MRAIQPLTNKEFNPFPINWTAQTKYLTFFKNISNKYGFIRGESGPDLIFFRPLLPGPSHIRTNIRNSQKPPPISRQFILNIFFDQFYNVNAGSDPANIDVMKAPPLFLVSHRRGQPGHIKSSHFQPIDRLQKHFPNALKRFAIIPNGMSHALPPLQKKSRHGELNPAMTPKWAVDYPVFHNQQSYPQNTINQLSSLPRQVFQRVWPHSLWFLQKGRNQGRPNAAMIPDLAAHFPGTGSRQEYLSAAKENRMASYPKMMLPGKSDSLLPYHSKTAERQAGQEKTEQKIQFSHDATAPLEKIVYKQNTNIDQLVKQSIKTEQVKNKNHDNMMQSKYPGQEYPPAQSDAATRGLPHRETKGLAEQVYKLIAKQVAFEKRRRGLS